MSYLRSFFEWNPDRDSLGIILAIGTAVLFLIIGIWNYFRERALDNKRSNAGTRPDQYARNLMIDLISVNDAIQALESGRVNSVFVNGRTYSSLDDLRALRQALVAKSRSRM